jgi:hypothetical protein
MLNLFRWALISKCPEIRDSRYKFSLRPSFFIKPWSKIDPGKDVVRKPSCFSDFPTLVPFVQNSLFCDWKQISSNRLCTVHHIAQSSLSRLKISPFISCNFNMCRYPHELFCLHSYTSEIFRDSIALIELILSVKIKYLSSDSFSIWSIAMWIAVSSAVKTLSGPLIRNIAVHRP